jgi:hypothetical protein
MQHLNSTTYPTWVVRVNLENDTPAELDAPELDAPEMDLHRVQEGQYHRHRYRTDASTISTVISMLSPI